MSESDAPLEIGARRWQALKHEYAAAELQPLTLTVSPGRCGTVFLQKLFSKSFGDRGVFLHEHLSAHAAQPALHHRCFDENSQLRMLAVDSIHDELCWLLAQTRERPVCEFGHYLIAAVPLLARLIPQSFRVLAVHRHPLQSAASHAIKGHYTINKSRTWAITPTHERVAFPNYAQRWEQMTPYEKELFRWLEITSYALELPQRIPGLRFKLVSSQELFNSPVTQGEIMQFCGFAPPQLQPAAEKANPTTDYNLEMMGIGDEWQRTTTHAEVMQLAESLGYDMSTAQLAQLIKPYQRPREWGAWLRVYSGYWHLRRWWGELRRSETAAEH